MWAEHLWAVAEFVTEVTKQHKTCNAGEEMLFKGARSFCGVVYMQVNFQYEHLLHNLFKNNKL